MAAEEKVVEQPHDARLVGRVLLAEELEQLDLGLRLQQEGPLALDDLDRHRLAPLRVLRLHDKAERALADNRPDNEPIVETLAGLDDVVVVGVVPAVVDRAPSRLALARAGLRSGRRLLLLVPLPLGVVSL
eukprot:2727912-Prymnesium_polylepis.1